MDDDHRAEHRRIEGKLDALQQRIDILILAAAATLASVTLALFGIIFVLLSTP